jgi:hypothetical protein
MVPTTAQAYYDYNNGAQNCTSMLKLQYWYQMHKYPQIIIMVPTTAQEYYNYNNGTKNCTSILKLQYWYKMHKYTKITIVVPTTVLYKHIKIKISVPKNTVQ